MYIAIRGMEKGQAKNDAVYCIDCACNILSVEKQMSFGSFVSKAYKGC